MAPGNQQRSVLTFCAQVQKKAMEIGVTDASAENLRTVGFPEKMSRTPGGRGVLLSRCLRGGFGKPLLFVWIEDNSCELTPQITENHSSGRSTVLTWRGSAAAWRRSPVTATYPRLLLSFFFAIPSTT